MRAAEETHIFDNAEDIDVNLAEHFHGLAHIGQRYGGWRRDQHRACHGDKLNQGKLHVSRAGGEVDDQVVEFSPQHAAQKLLHHAVQHWAAPDHRLIARIEQPHRNHFYALRHDRKNFALAQRLWLLVRAKHDRHVGTVHIRIEQSDRCTQILQGQREIHSDRGLSHAALAACNGNKIFYSLDGQFRRLRHRWWWHDQFLLNEQISTRRILRPFILSEK